MGLLKRKTLMAAKIESTAYTAESLANADSSHNFYDASMKVAIDTNQRMSVNTFSNRKSTNGGRSATITFQTDLVGNGDGAAPGWADLLLPACGFVKATNTFGPVSEAPGSSVKTLTIAVYEDGRKKLAKGCVGSFKLVCESGKDIMIEWTFTGAWVQSTDSAMLTPTYPTLVPFRFSSATVALGSYTPCLQKLEIDAGNNVVLREDPAETSGYKGAIITDRNIVGTADPESQLVAGYDTYGKWIANTEEAFSVAVDDGTDVVTITAPKCEITNIDHGDRNSLRTDPISFQANLDSSGDDELTIAFPASV